MKKVLVLLLSLVSVCTALMCGCDGHKQNSVDFKPLSPEDTNSEKQYDPEDSDAPKLQCPDCPDCRDSEKTEKDGAEPRTPHKRHGRMPRREFKRRNNQ